MRRTGRVVGVTVLALGLFLLGGAGLLTTVRTRDAAPAGGPAAAAWLARPGASAGTLDRAIAGLQERLRAAPGDWRSHAALGLAYVQQARVTGDPTYYPKAEGVLGRSLELNDRDNFDAMVAMGALELARHDFESALRWGERAVTLNRYNGNVHGVLGDALVELGRYDEAFRAFQRMIDVRPDLASYARASYALELQGEVDEAVGAMRRAVTAAGTPEDAAWATHQLGDLHWSRGRLDEAEAAYRRAVELSPSFVPARAGLANVAWARGRTDRAIADYTWVVQRYPSPEYVVALGELYQASGRGDLAAGQFELAGVLARLLEDNGVNVGVELTLFDADHGRAERALESARAEWQRRRSVHVADAFAWALYANGRYEDAGRYARRALGLGYRNALFIYHAGMIELRLGHREAARSLLSDALATNPHFSILHADRAATVLDRLGGPA